MTTADPCLDVCSHDEVATGAPPVDKAQCAVPPRGCGSVESFCGSRVKLAFAVPRALEMLASESDVLFAPRARVGRCWRQTTTINNFVRERHAVKPPRWINPLELHVRHSRVRLTSGRSAASGERDAHSTLTCPPLVGGSRLLGGATVHRHRLKGEPLIVRDTFTRELNGADTRDPIAGTMTRQC